MLESKISRQSGGIHPPGPRNINPRKPRVNIVSRRTQEDIFTSQGIYLAPRLYFVLRPTHVDGEDEVRHHVEGHVADNDPGGARLKLSLGKINSKKYGYDT